ncbi:hypothetical protein OS190_00725 [Sulfitobacter sp. F26204]|uniref:hypothetical protein n=1 Tax=Sulfitobacter sp. F26204 TaxID=2996014 RepID=UPI00225E0E58|nr:hypothetical protein [Sulfitobacter sp. F26204]MCX7558071.1 hypothetical protein [Sulfitobacter sp. F26204]
MITWNYKGALAALALISLAACEEGQGGAFPQTSTATRPVALSQAKMAFGAVTLMAPIGFCIDKSSLKQNFALMARCDALGAPSASAGAPTAILTASFSRASTTIPTALDTTTALGLDAPSDAVEYENSVTFRARGPSPAKGLSGTHWRGTARVGTQMMGLALYGPAGGRAVSAEGRALLVALIAKMSSETQD